MAENKPTVLVSDRKRSNLFKDALRFFTMRLARQNIKSYPQIAIFAFDYIGTTINIEGRFENRSLCLIQSYLQSVLPDLNQTSAIDIGANIEITAFSFPNILKRFLRLNQTPAHSLY